MWQWRVECRFISGTLPDDDSTRKDRHYTVHKNVIKAIDEQRASMMNNRMMWLESGVMDGPRVYAADGG